MVHKMKIKPAVILTALILTSLIQLTVSVKQYNYGSFVIILSSEMILLVNSLIYKADLLLQCYSTT